MTVDDSMRQITIFCATLVSFHGGVVKLCAFMTDLTGWFPVESAQQELSSGELH